MLLLPYTRAIEIRLLRAARYCPAGEVGHILSLHKAECVKIVRRFLYLRYCLIGGYSVGDKKIEINNFFDKIVGLGAMVYLWGIHQIHQITLNS